jgi:hypothetical protein
MAILVLPGLICLLVILAHPKKLLIKNFDGIIKQSRHYLVSTLKSGKKVIDAVLKF